VPALTPGNYTATWTVTNANGDTRTVTTRFIAQPALQGPQGAQGPQGPQGPQGAQGPQGPPGPKPTVKCKLEKHGKIKCTVSFGKKHGKHPKGRIAAVVTRGGHIVALGQARLVNGTATVTMRELRAWKRGSWDITLVLSQPAKAATTQTLTVRVR
jgi:PKD repeat protein